MTCEGCAQQQPAVAPGNSLAWQVYCRLAPGLRDGWGAVNLAGLEAGFRNLCLPARARPELQDKLVIILAGSLREPQKE